MATVRQSKSNHLINYCDDLYKELTLDSVNNFNEDIILLYIYRLPDYETRGYKIGMTICHPNENIWKAIKSRIERQVKELGLNDELYEKYGEVREVVYWGVCKDTRNDSFKDYYVHKRINELCAGLSIQTQEWFIGVPLDKLIEVYRKCRENGDEYFIYEARKPQEECVQKLKEYFAKNPIGKRFLLNCKMRFGKSYTTYKYCIESKLKKILILTFVPAVEQSWRDDLNHVKGGSSYHYYTDDNLKSESLDIANMNDPFVIFLSLQNYLGKDSKKEVKDKIKKLQNVDFDVVILDEYHFGAWNERTQETLEDFEPAYQKELKKIKGSSNVIEKFGIKTKQTICLSGTPFKAIAKGEFSEDNTFTYSYFDEQMNKYPNTRNGDINDKSVVDPLYAKFPDMKILGYNMSKLIPSLRENCISDDKLLERPYFSLNKFFKTEKDFDKSKENKFIYEEEIKHWLAIIKGLSQNDSKFPYSNPDLSEANRYTLWLMPSINSCEAMTNLLKEDEYFGKKYVITNLSDKSTGAGKRALYKLRQDFNSIKNDQNTIKIGSIAITVNKLTLGVTVKEWGSVFVLKDLVSPETYFQSIFRIQTPSDDPKKECGYVYDFNIDRAAALMLHFAEKSCDSKTTKQDICKLIVKYLPIYQNGDLTSPIDYAVFYDLANYGEANRVPLSRRIRDTEHTTRILDDDTIAMMMADPNVSDVIKHVFAHTKLNKAKTKTPIPLAPEGSNKSSFKEGSKAGYSKGRDDYEKFLDFDKEEIQIKFEQKIDEYLDVLTKDIVDNEERINFINGFKKGYENGINAPVRNLQCGKEDGINFAKKLKDKYKSDPEFYFEGSYKSLINNETNIYLNDESNIPKEYLKPLYNRFYKESFLKAVRNYLRRPKQVGVGESLEDTANVIQHILARLFQFLYISVYRETTFDEIFENADEDVFLEAVGITKKDFEILNTYHIYQEDVLNNYIKEFFDNESRGKNINRESPDVQKKYRNSFSWFGFNELTPEDKAGINEIIVEDKHLENKKEKELKHEDLLVSIEDIVLPSELNKQIDKDVYLAVYVIEHLMHLTNRYPSLKMIKNYLSGNVKSQYYKYFKNQPRSDSHPFLTTLKLSKVLDKLSRLNLINIVHGLIDEYHLRNK